MHKRKYNKVLLCLGAAAFLGILPGEEAKAAGEKKETAAAESMTAPQDSLFDVKNIWRAIGSESQYIEGLEDIGKRVLSQKQEEEPEELLLFARTESLVGTRVYANVINYVNVRQQASTASDVVGKLYGGCVATVIEEKEDWVYVNSGSVTGYVVKEYLLFGDEAEAAIIKKYAPGIKVTANELNIRSGAGLDCDVIGMFTKGAEAELLEQGKEWVKIRYDAGGTKKAGYVYAQYVEVTGKPEYGETLAEEAARIAAEKKAAAEAAAKAELERKAAAERANEEKAKQVADYAKTAVGTAYVWGGTNISTGVDCSGLCYAAYKKFGYTLPRVSRDMAASQSLLSVTPNTTYLKAGDLVFYASGGVVDHVAMYIGNGKVVHASDYSTGVIISNYNYRTPHSAKRVIY
ncbi:MAG: C40 family peptidase [Lachnospiraceae bacterium]|nr:C40 family peptidase [Lachnospiraceae bacterium]